MQYDSGKQTTLKCIQNETSSKLSKRTALYTNRFKLIIPVPWIIACIQQWDMSNVLINEQKHLNGIK